MSYLYDEVSVILPNLWNMLSIPWLREEIILPLGLFIDLLRNQEIIAHDCLSEAVW